MANYASLKAAIQDVIKTNGNNEITGALLQQSLLAMINSLGGYYQFAGIATPSTNPGTPDQNVFYLASTAGTYSNFGSIVIAENEAAILKYNGTWSKDSSGFATSKKVGQLEQEKVDISSTNLIDETKLETGKGFYVSNGNIGNNADLSITDYIPVNGKDIICNAFFNVYWGGVVYDSNKQKLRTISTTQYTYQSGDAYIRLSFLNSNTKKRANYGTTLADYVEYNPIDGYLASTIEGINNLSQEIDDANEEIERLDFDVNGEDAMSEDVTISVTSSGVPSSILHTLQTVLKAGKEYTFSIEFNGHSETMAVECRNADNSALIGVSVDGGASVTSFSITPGINNRKVVPSADVYGVRFYLASGNVISEGNESCNISRDAVPGCKDKIEALETKDVEFEDSIEQLQKDVNVETLTKLTLTRATGNFEYSGGNIVTSGTTSRYMYYYLCSAETRVKVTGTVSNVTKPVYMGYTTVLPANGVALNDVKTETTDYAEYITIPANCYLCILVNWSYHSIPVAYSVREQKVNSAVTEMMAGARNVLAAMYDDRILDIEYSVIYPIPGNTMKHFTESYGRGFRALKADMRLTADGKIVLCHDAGYTLDGNGRITTFDSENYTAIHTMVLSDILDLEFAADNTVHPCTLEDFILFTKQRKVVPYITLRQEYLEDTVPEMLRVLRKFKMEDKAIINLFPGTDTIIGALNAVKTDWLICDTRYSNETFNTTMIDKSAEWGCSYLCLWDEQLPSVTDALVIYASSKGIRILILLSDVSQAQTKMEKGIVGFQNYTITPVV